MSKKFLVLILLLSYNSGLISGLNTNKPEVNLVDINLITNYFNNIERRFRLVRSELIIDYCKGKGILQKDKDLICQYVKNIADKHEDYLSACKYNTELKRCVLSTLGLFSGFWFSVYHLGGVLIANNELNKNTHGALSAGGAAVCGFSIYNFFKALNRLSSFQKLRVYYNIEYFLKLLPVVDKK